MAKRTKADWTAEDLARQSEAAAALIGYLATVDEDDDDLIQDSIEGETDFLETIDRALEQIAEAEMMSKALAGRVADLQIRKKRFDDKASFMRHAIEMAMAQANGDADERPFPFTLITPAATVTIREGKSKVIIEDEAKLPARFWRTPDPVVDKTALNEYVAEWRAFWDRSEDSAEVIEDDDTTTMPEDLPDGVSLSDKGFSLTIRRK